MKTENEIIAIFMGAVDDEEAGTYNFSPRENYHPEDLKYQTSWGWLRPVVEKISKMYDADFEDGIYYNEEFAHGLLDLRLMPQ